MTDTSERIRRAKEAAGRLARRRERNALRRLSALCAALALSPAGALARFTGGAEGAVLGMHGATLLSDSAGGYVLVGVASFAAAVALTLACVRLREQGRRSGSKDREKTEPPPAER